MPRIRRRTPRAERYGDSDYEAAAEASAGLIQPKAIHAAQVEHIAVEVAAIGHHEATVIAALPARKEVPVEWQPLRVSLLGCGAVGAGVLFLSRAAAGPVQVKSGARPSSRNCI
jgi:homoserine dehydrogenase